MPLLCFQNIDFLYNAPYRMRLSSKNWGPGWRLEGPEPGKWEFWAPLIPMCRNCPKIESWNTFKLDLKNIWHLSEIELYALEVFCQKSKGSRRKTFPVETIFFVFGTEEVVLMQRIQSNKFTVIQLCAICFYLFLF